MARLVWLSGLIVAVIASKLNPSRLTVDGDDVPKRFEDNSSVVLKSADGQKHPAATAVGSLTCMRWTGGSCKFFACQEERRATCDEGYCMCKQGTCADSEGKCVPYSKGEWIGEYSIRFSKPFLPDRPFLGIGSFDTVASGKIGPLATVSTSDKQWKIAQTPHGRVRLTNTKHPGSVLTMHVNRRRRSDFMQLQSRPEQKKMSDNDDLWPVLKKLEETTPLEATFQVRPTLRNGGGYELWNPANQVSLANADPESWGDMVVKQGVTECYHKGMWGSDPCEEGRQLIAFDPALPSKVLVESHRANIVAIHSNVEWWMWSLFFFCLFCWLFGLPCLDVLQEGFESRSAMAASDAVLQRECALKAQVFADKIAGSWVLESDVGTFEYELQTTSGQYERISFSKYSGISVHGREQGASKWDSMFAGQLCIQVNWPVVDGPGIHVVDQLCWEDDSRTKFTLMFEDDTCSGAAMAAGGQEVSFTGKRTEPNT